MKFYISRYEPLKQELEPLTSTFEIKEDQEGHYIEMDLEKTTLESLGFIVSELSGTDKQYRFMVCRNQTKWELVLID